MLTRLAERRTSAYHDTVAMPYSKIKSHVAEILQQEGYKSPPWRVERTPEVGKNPRDPPLKIRETSASARSPASSGVSKPGLRVYAKKDQPCPGSWAASAWRSISTSGGLLTEQAGPRKSVGVGGEVLAYVLVREAAIVKDRAAPRDHPQRGTGRHRRAPRSPCQGPKGNPEAHRGPTPIDVTREDGVRSRSTRPNDEGPGGAPPARGTVNAR